jgi:hypothetical protein
MLLVSRGYASHLELVLKKMGPMVCQGSLGPPRHVPQKYKLLFEAVQPTETYVHTC